MRMFLAIRNSRSAYAHEGEVTCARYQSQQSYAMYGVHLLNVLLLLHCVVGKKLPPAARKMRLPNILILLYTIIYVKRLLIEL